MQSSGISPMAQRINFDQNQIFSDTLPPLCSSHPNAIKIAQNNRSNAQGKGHDAPLFDAEDKPQLDHQTLMMIRDDILTLVSKSFSVKLTMLKKPSRCKAPIALARQIAMYLFHVRMEPTLTETGEIFSRDRTTIAHALAKIEDLRDDAQFDEKISDLEQQVEQIAKAAIQRTVSGVGMRSTSFTEAQLLGHLETMLGPLKANCIKISIDEATAK